MSLLSSLLEDESHSCLLFDVCSGETCAATKHLAGSHTIFFFEFVFFFKKFMVLQDGNRSPSSSEFGASQKPPARERRSLLCVSGSFGLMTIVRGQGAPRHRRSFGGAG